MSRELFSSADWLVREKNRGYGDLPIPQPRDKEIAHLVKTWIALGVSERREAASGISAKQSFTLLAFCERMATLAVRERAAEHLLLGLLALGIDKVDWRDNLRVLSLCYDAARRIGSDPEAVFESAAALLPSEGVELLHMFLRRSERNKSIEVMCFQVGEDAQGFRYKDVIDDVLR